MIYRKSQISRQLWVIFKLEYAFYTIWQLTALRENLDIPKFTELSKHKDDEIKNNIKTTCTTFKALSFFKLKDYLEDFLARYQKHSIKTTFLSLPFKRKWLGLGNQSQL